MAVKEESVLLPSRSGVGESFSDLLRDIDLQFDPGGSTVLFAPGRVASANTKQLLTVLVVAVDLDEEDRERVYRYLFAIQAITHRLRPVILTDGEDLRAIRRYGWVTEHVMSRSSHESLSIPTEWEKWIVNRIETSASRLDAGCLLVCGPSGVSASQHDRLMRRMKQFVPYAAVKV